MDQMIVSVIFFIALLLAAGVTLLFVLRRSQRAKERYIARQDASGPADHGQRPQEARNQMPESSASRSIRLRRRLAGSGDVGKALLSLLSRNNLKTEDWDNVEELLLTADVGVDATEEIVGLLRESTGIRSDKTAGEVKEVLVAVLTTILNPEVDRSLSLERQENRPAAMLVVGVNGAGKTTTVGKMARFLKAEGYTVTLGAADTFRAAAAEQLKTWGGRIGVSTVTGEIEGSDPAAVAYRAVETGIAACSDAVIVDTAGRLQNKTGLMDELAKIRRVIEKQTTLNEVLLVIDATTGQNGLNQAKIFKEAVNITGIVLTKLDGTAKGGIVVAIQRELGVPVKLVGLGEGLDDLIEFNPREFAAALVDEG